MLRAASLAIVIAGVGVATPAFATGAIATTTSVTANLPTIVSGHTAVFHALVTPATAGPAKPTGTVTWTVTDSHGTVVPCTATLAFGPSGKSMCRITTPTLLAAGSPFTATAKYSGDTNYGGSSGSTMETVVPAATRVRIVISAPPTSGASTTIEAYVFGGVGTPAITGNVTFAVASGFTTRGVRPYCEGSLTPLSANNSKPVIGGFATCTLPVGWFIVQPPTTTSPHPRTRWSVSASYDGNASFDSTTQALSGASSS
jgi:hypothetical protein